MSVTTGGPRDFDRWVKRMGQKEVPDWVESAFKKVFIQVGNSVIEGTPVGDANAWLSMGWYTDLATREVRSRREPPKGYTGGRARGGWQPTVGLPAMSDVERIDKRGSKPKGEGKTTALGLKVGQTAYWTNNTPYILRLAHGWSRQAPDGWVPRAIRKVANQFRR